MKVSLYPENVRKDRDDVENPELGKLMFYPNIVNRCDVNPYRHKTSFRVSATFGSGQASL